VVVDVVEVVVVVGAAVVVVVVVVVTTFDCEAPVVKNCPQAPPYLAYILPVSEFNHKDPSVVEVGAVLLTVTVALAPLDA